jgi:hypothetical protein
VTSPSTSLLDLLIAIVVTAIAVLAGIGTVIPTALNYALFALIAGRLGITVPKPPTP